MSGYRQSIDRADRAKAAVLTGVVVAGLGAALVGGLAVRMPDRVEQALSTFALTLPPPPPPEPIRPPAPKHAAKSGKAASPNLKSTPTEVVAPPPPVPLPPPPIAAAPIAGPGVQASAGAALVRGPGTGAGGLGNGTGSGNEGDGPGAGGGTPLRHVSGEIRGDYPKGLMLDGTRTVYFRFVVGVKGRVTSCDVTRSSGLPQLDNLTCELVTKRFRYEPERDRRGIPVAVTVTGEQEWWGKDGRHGPDYSDFDD